MINETDFFFVLEVFCSSSPMPANSRVVAGINNEKICFKVDFLCISKIGGFEIQSHISFYNLQSRCLPFPKN